METPDRWHEIDRLFAEALDRPEGERLRYLQATCGDDQDLRGAVTRLVKLAERLGPFLSELDPRLVAEAWREILHRKRKGG